MNLTNQSFHLNISYEFVSDPPIIADFGDLYINIDNISCFFNLLSKYDRFNGTDFYFD